MQGCRRPVSGRSCADSVAAVAEGMIKIKRTDFNAGKLMCPRCRKPVDPKTTSVTFVPMTSWDPIGDGDRRTEDAFASLRCPKCDEVIRVDFIVEDES